MKLVVLLAMVLINGDSLPSVVPPDDQRVHLSPEQRGIILQACENHPLPGSQKLARARYCECVVQNVSKYVTQDEYDRADQATDQDDFHRQAPVTGQIIRYCLALSPLDT